MWGALRERLYSILGTNIRQLLMLYSKERVAVNNMEMSLDFTRDVLWPLVRKFSYCHEKESCNEIQSEKKCEGKHRYKKNVNICL